jgi:hypothetical protein
VMVTEAGKQKARELFGRFFGNPPEIKQWDGGIGRRVYKGNP